MQSKKEQHRSKRPMRQSNRKRKRWILELGKRSICKLKGIDFGNGEAQDLCSARSFRVKSLHFICVPTHSVFYTSCSQSRNPISLYQPIEFSNPLHPNSSSHPLHNPQTKAASPSALTTLTPTTVQPVATTLLFLKFRPKSHIKCLMPLKE